MVLKLHFIPQILPPNLGCDGVGTPGKSFRLAWVIQQDLHSFGNTQQSFCFTAQIFHQIWALGSPHGRQKILAIPSKVLWDISQGRCCFFPTRMAHFPQPQEKNPGVLVFCSHGKQQSHHITQVLEPKPGICSHLQNENFSSLKNAIFVQPCSHPLC